MAAGGDSRAVIRQAVADILAGPKDQEKRGYRQLLAEIYDAIDGGIRHALKWWDASHGTTGVQADDVFNRFIDVKLKDRDFLEELLRSPRPVGLVFRSAANLAIDVLRASGRVRLVPPPPETGHQAPSGLDMDRFQDVEHEWNPAELATYHEDQRRLIDDLAPEQQIMLRLVLGVDLTDDQIDTLASIRRVERAVVEKELDERFSVIDRARNELQDELDRRRFRLRSLERRHNAVLSAIRQRNGANGGASVEPEDRKNCGKESWLLKARPGERAWCEEYLRGILVRQAELYQEASRKLRDPAVKNPRYREVAALLGRIDAASSEQAKMTAENTVTVQVKRLLRRLVKAHVRGGIHDW